MQGKERERVYYRRQRMEAALKTLGASKNNSFLVHFKMPDTLQFRPLLQETNRTNDLFQSEPFFLSPASLVVESQPCPRAPSSLFVVALRRLSLISAIDIAATHVAAIQSTLLLFETKDCA